MPNCAYRVWYVFGKVVYQLSLVTFSGQIALPDDMSAEVHRIHPRDRTGFSDSETFSMVYPLLVEKRFTIIPLEFIPEDSGQIAAAFDIGDHMITCEMNRLAGIVIGYVAPMQNVGDVPVIS